MGLEYINWAELAKWVGIVVAVLVVVLAAIFSEG